MRDIEIALADALPLIRARLLGLQAGPTADTGPVREIVAKASEITGICAEHIEGKPRDRVTCWVRSAVIVAAARRDPSRLPAIGVALGGRDRTTVLSSFRRGEKLAATDPAFQALCAVLTGAAR